MYKIVPSYPLQMIESCDYLGSVRNTFNAGESVYVSGMGFPVSSTFDISIINDVVSWTSMSGLPIPASLSGNLHNVTSDASGLIAVNLLWSSPPVGNYDILVDVNRNGVYDPGVDAIDSDDVVTAGVAVVSELGALAIIGMLGASTVLLAFDRPGKRRTDQRLGNF